MSLIVINDHESLSLLIIPLLGRFNQVPSNMVIELEREVEHYPAPGVSRDPASDNLGNEENEDKVPSSQHEYPASRETAILHGKHGGDLPHALHPPAGHRRDAKAVTQAAEARNWPRTRYSERKNYGPT